LLVYLETKNFQKRGSIITFNGVFYWMEQLVHPFIIEQAVVLDEA
jgi:hypothetical protein